MEIRTFVYDHGLEISDLCTGITIRNVFYHTRVITLPPPPPSLIHETGPFFGMERYLGRGHRKKFRDDSKIAYLHPALERGTSRFKRGDTRGGRGDELQPMKRVAAWFFLVCGEYVDGVQARG